MLLKFWKKLGSFWTDTCSQNFKIETQRVRVSKFVGMKMSGLLESFNNKIYTNEKIIEGLIVVSGPRKKSKFKDYIYLGLYSVAF